MSWWPWVTREHHAEVVAAMRELAASLKAQNAVLAARLAEPVAVTVALPDDFCMVQPALVRRLRPSPVGPDSDHAAPINWDGLDENDPVVIAKIAAQELGGNTSPFLLARKVASIKNQIRAARLKKMTESIVSGRVGIIAAPATEAEAEEQGPEYVPSFIRNLVDQAERV